MEYTLLDTIKSKSGKRNETGLIKYQSLPQGVKDLSCRREWLFFKYWWVIFEGALDLSKLEAICRENNYSLITEEPAKSFPLPFIEETRNLDPTLEKIAKLLDLTKPDSRYRIYSGEKELVCINWYDHNKDLYFGTSQKKGLKLAEDYRKSLLKR